MVSLDPMRMLVQVAGSKVLHTTLGDLAVNPRCQDVIGASMYQAEKDENAPPWTSLTNREKREWMQRAQQAVLGMRQYILGPKPPPGG